MLLSNLLHLLIRLSLNLFKDQLHHERQVAANNFDNAVKVAASPNVMRNSIGSQR